MGTVTAMPRAGVISRAELDALPDDGRRHELLDGVLIVTPAPSHRHQRASLQLAMLLAQHCPAALEVITAPFDVVLSEDSVLQPDLLVARRSDFTDRDLPNAPLLAAEILSASTRRLDLHLKLSRYEAAGCPAHWVLDPDLPSLTAWELRDGRYVEVATISGDETFRTAIPFEVAVAPSRLVD